MQGLPFRRGSRDAVRALTYAATLAKILPDSRLFAYKLLLEKAKLEEPESVSAARLKRRTA